MTLHMGWIDVAVGVLPVNPGSAISDIVRREVADSTHQRLLAPLAPAPPPPRKNPAPMTNPKSYQPPLLWTS